MTIRRRVREALDAVAPGLAATAGSIRSRRLSHRLVRQWGLTSIDDKLVERWGLTVRAGPFAGLQLPAGARAEHLAPFLLGTYESELHPWLEELKPLPFRQILDVGAKFGYYALGLARWFRDAQSIAIDPDPWARRMLREGARQNGLESIEVRGFLAPERLAAVLRPPALLISDCEGYERELLGCIRPARLECVWMIVEIHERAVPGVGAWLRTRFEETHDVETVERAERVPPPELVEVLDQEEARRAVTEARGEQSWALFRPRAWS